MRWFVTNGQRHPILQLIQNQYVTKLDVVNPYFKRAINGTHRRQMLNHQQFTKDTAVNHSHYQFSLTALQKCKVSLHMALDNNFDKTLIYNVL